MTRKTKLRVLAICGLSILAGTALFWLTMLGWLRLNYPSAERYPIQGIDVSHHQGMIDWQRVAAVKHIKFAYIKATEGGDFKDSEFQANWRNAKQARLIRGAYHYFTFCRPGRDQALNFLSAVPPETGTLPMAIDLEFGGNCKYEPTLLELLRELKAFVDELQKIRPMKPIFYVTPEFFDRYLKGNTSRFPDHYLWLRNIFYEPKQAHCARWTIWQFANSGTVDGISVPVDLNVLCPDQSDLMPLFAGNADGIR